MSRKVSFATYNPGAFLPHQHSVPVAAGPIRPPHESNAASLGVRGDDLRLATSEPEQNLSS